MDYKTNNEKVSRITFEEADKEVASRITKSNLNRMLNGSLFMILAIAISGYYAYTTSGIARIILSVFAAIMVFFLILTLLPQKVKLHDETFEATDVRSEKEGATTNWIATVYVPEIDDKLDGIIYYIPSGLPGEHMVAPIEDGDKIKIVMIGRAYYFVPEKEVV